MAKELWEIWLEKEGRVEKDFQRNLRIKKIKVETETTELIKGHLEKADHNLKFVANTLDLKSFNDWAIVSAYYAIYHASMALCALKGYSTKDHLATLLVLIKEFYKRELTKEDIVMVSKTTLEKEEVLYYVEAKDRRSKASYSTDILFDIGEAESLQKRAIAFVNKVKQIIENYKK
jgi:uncharacterized protein (UPF0332 family)